MNRAARIILLVLATAVGGCSDKSPQTPKEFAPPPGAGSGGGLKGGEPAAPPSIPKK
jgi:hypothetical protein